MQDVLPAENKQYSTREYWEERYTKDKETFDWFKGWDELKDVLSNYIKKEDKVLMVGCGNSKLSEDMYKDGYQDIVNIDFSSQVIRTMSERCKDMDKMQWIEMDATQMTFSDATFDISIDKGTLDAVLTEQTSVWEVEEHLAVVIDKMLSESSRVLKPGGTFIYITFGQPHFRKNLLAKEKYGWNFEVKTIGDAFHYFIYVMKKVQ